MASRPQNNIFLASNVTYDDREYAVIQEGRAQILVPPATRVGDGSSSNVFYNPIQQFNRDLTVLAIKTFYDSRKTQPPKKSQNTRKRPRKEDDTDVKRQKVDLEDAPTSESTETPPTALVVPETTASTTGADAVSTSVKTSDVDMVDSTLPTSDHAANGANAETETATSHKSAEAPETRATTEATATMAKSETHKPPFTILDALSASGLRALRYAHELPFVTSVTANDLSETAVQDIQLNIQHNKLDTKIVVSHDDAIAHMYRRIADDLSRRDKKGNPSSANKYHVVDLDPYGTAAPFLDAAVQSVRDGGLLCVTCTDSAVWAGHSYCEKSFANYGGIPAKAFFCHEAGLRLILHAVATSASRYGLAIEPLLSVSADFYIRLFIRVTKSQAAVKFHASKTMLVYNCDQGCGAWETQPIMRNRAVQTKSGKAQVFKHTMALGPTSDRHCHHCGSKMHVAGPMYAGYIQSPSFIRKLLENAEAADPQTYGTLSRIEGVLSTALEENIPGPLSFDEDTKIDPREKEASIVDPYPFFVILSRVAGVLNCNTPNEDLIRGALRHLGYTVTRSHCKPNSIKTNAPWSSIFWVMREYIRQCSPVKTTNIRRLSPAWYILQLGKDGNEDLYGQKAKVGETPSEDPSQNPSTNSADLGEALLPALALPEPTVGEEEAQRRATLVFDDNLERLGRDRQAKRIVRYQQNPRENWGPMSRARG